MDSNDNGFAVLIVLSKKDRKIRAHYGKDYRDNFRSKTTKIMNEKIVPLLKQGKFSLGLKIAVKEYSNLGQSNPTLTFKKIIDQLYPYLKIFFLAMLSPVGFVFLFLFLLFKMLKDPKGGILSSRRTNLPTTHKKKSSFFSDSSGCGGDSDGDTGSF